MKMVFDENVDRCDYLEFILSPTQAAQIMLEGLVSEFPYGLKGKRNLNVFIRVDRTLEDYAISEGESCEVKGRIFGECTQGDGRGKTTKTGRSHRI
jgi:hypothetical protein